MDLRFRSARTPTDSRLRGDARGGVDGVREELAAGVMGHVSFSNRPSGSSTFRLSTTSSVDVAHGLTLLFGLGTKALPSWDSKMGWNNLSGDLAVNVTAGSSRHTNSPHPSSREGHHS